MTVPVGKSVPAPKLRRTLVERLMFGWTDAGGEMDRMLRKAVLRDAAGEGRSLRESNRG